jgi:hypothetical protein
MPNFSIQQVKEINRVIEQIEKSVKPGSEIGAREKTILVNLLSANSIAKKPIFFACKREYSDTIVSHFQKTKGLPRNKFSSNAQPFIFIIH